MSSTSWVRCNAFHHSTTLTCGTEKRDLPNGSCFYLPTADLDLMSTLDMDNDTQEVFADFMAWIANYNQYILNEWSDKMQHSNEEIQMPL